MTGDQRADHLLVSVSDGVGTITLNRPHKRNAVTYEMWNRLASVCEDLGADPEVRMLVVRGAGDHFCAGADIAGLGDVHPLEYRAANEAADHALATFPKPTIAVVTGACIGGGTEIAVACDLRLADTSARFGITPARLGIVYPAAATARVVRTIGASATKHLLFSAEVIDAHRALRIGLVDELHDPSELPGRVENFVDLVAHQRSLLTQMASKEIVEAVAGGRDGPGTDPGADLSIDPAIVARWDAVSAAAPDAAEGVTAFVERRTPHFTWTPEQRNEREQAP